MSNLIPKVAAQSEPTFNYEGPYEGPEPTPTTPGEANVKLSTNTNSLQTGQTVTCDVQIESRDEEIDEYSLLISFDPEVLEVIDSNTSQSGIQIEVLDPAASSLLNNANNSTGSVALSVTLSGSPQTINRKVAQISFRAKSTGSSVVSVNKGESYVTNDSGNDILGATTSLNFTITGQTETPQQPTLPSSGIFDTVATFGSVFTGIILLYVGIKTVIDKKKGKNTLDF